MFDSQNGMSQIIFTKISIAIEKQFVNREISKYKSFTLPYWVTWSFDAVRLIEQTKVTDINLEIKLY